MKKTEETLAELKKKLEECEKTKQEYLSGWQRARADLLNYKKDEQERLARMARYAKEEIILNILAVLDNFDIIEKKLSPELRKNPYIKGVLQIKKQFKDFLEDQGMEEIKAMGEVFDPRLHEPAEEVDSSLVSGHANALIDKKTIGGKEIKSGMIIEEIQKGYILNGKVIRPAKVKVNK